jgi:hypothetical protein
MKLLAYLVGAICLVAAALYLALPAESLPTFFPGFEPGMARIRLKHGIAAGAAGVVLFLIGWWLGRRG